MKKKCQRGLATGVNCVHWTVAGLLYAAIEAWGVAPHLASVLPTGGQRGTQVEVGFHGDRLQDTEEIICYEPGLEVVKLGPAKDHLVTAQVKIATDCSLGEHHLRLRAATGVSELRTFFVGPYPVVPEREPNNDLTNAQEVELNRTVTGVITSEDVDCFAVEARQGDRLAAEVEGMRLGRSFFDPRLALLDSRGAVLADVDDTQLAMQDPFLSLVVPKDGIYIFRLRDATYGGNNDCHYRLHIGAFPRPTSVYPLGGKAGENLTLTFFSEATGSFTQPVKLPPTPSDKFGVFAELGGLVAPSPNWIRVSDFPNVLETSTNACPTTGTVAGRPGPRVCDRHRPGTATGPQWRHFAEGRGGLVSVQGDQGSGVGGGCLCASAWLAAGFGAGSV